jgi:hypothetical protein
MDVFSNPQRNSEKLKKFQQLPLLFSPFENSTCSMNGYLNEVNFDEEEVIPFMSCEGNIIKIDCNFGHKYSDYYKSQTVEKKSNRGRKKKDKPKKTRKYQGDGSSFNSQITFVVLGTHIRKKPYMPDKHSVKAIKCGKNLESVTKEYKIKVFRNGSITVPGVLTEDMSDINQPLNEVCKYLSSIFIANVKPLKLFSVMRNYKCRLLEGMIDIRQLQAFCERHFVYLINTSFSDIVDFLINPAFEKLDISPLFEGWNTVLEAGLENSNDLDLSFPEMRRYLSDSLNSKNLYVNFDKLVEKIEEYPLHQDYQVLQNFYDAVNNSYKKLDNIVYKTVLKYIMCRYVKNLKMSLMKSGNNLLSHIKYDPEKYPGFLVKIKTPNITDADKLTTIKIFPSGKINIDGANNRQEAEYIYYWINSIFYDNPKLIYNPDESYDTTDSEYSTGSETDEDDLGES